MATQHSGSDSAPPMSQGGEVPANSGLQMSVEACSTQVKEAHRLLEAKLEVMSLPLILNPRG